MWRAIISHKSYWDSLFTIFSWKSHANVRLAQRYPESSLSPVQCCTKSRKAMPGNGGQ